MSEALLTQPWRFVFLGYRAALANPTALVLVPILILLGLLALRATIRSQRKLETLVSPELAERLAPARSTLRPRVQVVGSLVGLLLLALALAQPQCGTRSTLVKRRGVDVVVALDASKSMLARDVKPTRLERAKLELMTLLDELKGDRVAIVVFAGDAFVQCPLTSDYEAARLFLRAVAPGQMQQGGTNVGGALQLAKQVLTTVDHGAKQQVVVLLSDGEDLTGEVDSAVEGLKEANIPVLAVGIGSESGEPIPILNNDGQVVDYQKDESGQTVMTKLNRAGLASIAEATGGAYFFRPQGVAVPEAAERIDKMQKSELESRLTVEYDERYAWLAWPGLAIWAASVLIRPSRKRREA
jgi:Ca-activated chloride channel family protein